MKINGHWLLRSMLAAGVTLSFAAPAYAEVQAQKIPAPAGATTDRFGFAVATSGGNGETALVGAPGSNPPSANDSGKAFIFTRSGTTWSAPQQLTSPNSAAQDFFGGAVALNSSGTVAIVGAPGNAYASGQESEPTAKGAAFIYVLKNKTWTYQATLTENSTTDEFGFSVALNSNGTEALVGAPGETSNQGAAYLFTEKNNAWTQTKEFTDPGNPTAAGGDNFGFSVSLQGTTALIGADQAGNAGGSASGAGFASVYTEKSNTWPSTPSSQLTDPNGTTNDAFGDAVALDSAGTAALIGAPGVDSYTGAAYTYVAKSNAWSNTQTQTLTDPGANTGDYFGNAVALGQSASNGVVGAPFTLNYSGTAHRYNGAVGSWGWPLTQSDSGQPSDYGYSVALDTAGTAELIGATGEDNNSGDGAVYAYQF